MRTLRMVCVTAVIAAGGCGGEDGPPVCDATGDWEVAAMPGGGDCGVTGTQIFTLSISRDGQGNYVLAPSEPGFMTEILVIDNDGACGVIATEVDPDLLDDGGSTRGTLSWDIVSDLDGNVTGSGTISISGAASCTQSFDVVGTRQVP